MQLKDYYSTLDVAPAATPLQIKKSFRQLALRHHPDKNPGNAVAEAKFREVQEAYDVLSNPQKREEYNYKRWYSRSLKKTFSNEPLTPREILAECERLNNYLLTVNNLRVDYDGLSYHIRQLLNDKNIAILHQSADTFIISKVIDDILRSCALLPFKYIAPIASLLLRLADNDQLLISQINQFTRQHRQISTWQQYRVPVVIAVTLLLCILIYFISR